MPETICLKCSEQANIAYLFRKLCESSDITLRELSKQYEASNDLPSKEISLEQNCLSRNNEIGKNSLTKLFRLWKSYFTENSLNRSYDPTNDFYELGSTDEGAKEVGVYLIMSKLVVVEVKRILQDDEPKDFIEDQDNEIEKENCKSDIYNCEYCSKRYLLFVFI